MVKNILKISLYIFILIYVSKFYIKFYFSKV